MIKWAVALILLVIVIILIVVFVVYKHNTHKKNIIMFIDPSNKDCIIMITLLGTEKAFDKITLINVATTEGKDIASKHNVDISILPLYINTENGKKSTGIKKGFQDIVNELS